MSKSANLYVLLGFDPKNFNSGVKSTKDAIKGLGTDVRSTLSGIDSAVKGLGSSNAQFERLVTNASDTEQNIGSMKRQLKELSKMDFSKLSDQEIAGVKKRMAELTDAIGDAQTAIKQMALDPFQKMAASIKTVSTLAEGVTGTMSLFGANTDTVNQYMQKTVALMGIANAAQEASVFFNETALGLTIKQKAAHLANIPAIMAVNAAMKANPAALIATAIIAIGTAIAVWATNANKAKQSLDLYLEATGRVKARYDTLTDNMSLQEKYLRSQNASEGAIYEWKRKQLALALQNLKVQLDMASIGASWRGKSAKDLNDEEKQQLKDWNEAAKKYNELRVQIAEIDKAHADFKQQQRENESKAQEAANRKYLESDKGKIKTIEEGYNRDLLALNNQLNNKYLSEQAYSEKLYELRQSTLEELSKINGNSKLRDSIILDPPRIESESIDTSEFDIANYLKADTAKADEIIEGINTSIAKIDVTPFETIESKLSNMKGGLEANAQAFGMLGDAIGGNAGDWLSWGAQTMSTIAQLIPQVAALLGIQLAQGAAAQAKLPFPFNLAAMAATAAGALSIISSIPKFANGGIVPGTSFSGDRVPALVNSGEMILNSGQQGNLFRMLNGGIAANGNAREVVVTGELRGKGDTLIAVISNTNKRNSKTR